MRVHVVRHVPFEGPARIAEWALERGHTVTESLALLEAHPRLDEFELLVVMGGPMSADNHAEHPWLEAEKRFVAEAIDGGRRVLGVCLGAQIIAAVLGASVRGMGEREIGWYEIRPTPAAANDPVFSAFPERLVVGHWHGDTFEVPRGAVLTASSEACAHQSFSFDTGRVVGLQFHLEWDEAAVGALVDACSDELAEAGNHVMTANGLRAGARKHVDGCRAVLWQLLDSMSVAEGAR